MTDRTGLLVAVFAYTTIAVLFGIALRHVCQIIRTRKPVREPVMLEGECPLESAFWPWYDALLAQDDFSYAEAKMLYRLLDHKDVYRRQEPSTAHQIDDMPL